MKYNKQEDTVKLDKFEVINLAWDLYKMRKEVTTSIPEQKVVGLLTSYKCRRSI